MRFINLVYRIYPALPWFAEYRLALEIAKKYNCRSFLDVGCGKGNLFKILDSHGLVDKYVCIDKYDMFSVKSEKARFIKHDARIPLPLNEGFDCVFFVNSIFYMGLQVLNNFRRAGDIISIIDIDPKTPHVFMLSKVENLKRLSLKELEHEVEAMGFKVLRKFKGTTYALVLAP